MSDDIRCDYSVPGPMGDEDAFALMVDAFVSGMIGPAERLPVLRLFTGATELVFALGDGGADRSLAGVMAGAATIRISPSVQLQLVAHFSHWLKAN